MVSSAGACEVVREQRLILDLSSNEVGASVPLFYAMHLRDENDFPAPGLIWSAVPPETTEIAILVLSVNEDRAASLLQVAKTFHDRGMTKQAIGRLETCIKKYPDTEAAQEARVLLKKWR